MQEEADAVLAEGVEASRAELRAVVGESSAFHALGNRHVERRDVELATSPPNMRRAVIFSPSGAGRSCTIVLTEINQGPENRING